MPDIPVWPECDIRCVFCSNPVEGFRGTAERYGFAEFRARWDGYRAGKPTYLKFDARRDYCSLTGGEPTLHPRFLRILRVLRADMRGKRLRLLTNARRFADEPFAALALRAAAAPLVIGIPLLGPDAASHDAIARVPGSFERTLRGLDNLLRHRRPGQLVEGRVILHRLQLRRLDALLEWIPRRLPGLDAVELLFVEIEGHAERHWPALRLTMSECARELDRRFDALRRLREFRLLHFPLCVLSPRLRPFARATLDAIKVCFKPGCGACALRAACVGIHLSYARRVGLAEFAPERREEP